MVALPAFVDSGDLKNLWFADLLAAKPATETQWGIFAVGPTDRPPVTADHALLAHQDARDRGGPYAGRMILFLLPINIELVEKCDKITGLLPVLQTRIDHLRARNLRFWIRDIFSERGVVPGNPRILVGIGI